MSKRNYCLLFAGSTACLGAVGVAALVLSPPRTAITRENAALVDRPMTLSEVEAILGGPARDESTGARQGGILVLFGKTHLIWTTEREWVSDDVHLIVHFDGNDRVTGGQLLYVHRETVLERLRAWLGL